jgi:hypothetical protein
MRRSVREITETTPWNPMDEDVPRILEILMFHNAAGGATYTRLVNRYHEYLDLSDHLTCGNAILFGRSEKRLTELTLDNGRTPGSYDHTWTFCRIVFPVDETPVSKRDRARD